MDQTLSLGWTESEGLRRELHAARSLGLPIYSPAQFRLPQPDAAVMTNAWFGGPEFLSEVNK